MRIKLKKLASQVIKGARKSGTTLATAESCTGGYISKLLTDVPGSSAVYEGSVIAYSNEVKEKLLRVPKDVMIEHGAVSEMTARHMAENALKIFATDAALSVTGIAGPSGGSENKPVGLVYMAIAQKDGKTETYKFEYDNKGRDSVRRAATRSALEFLHQISLQS